MNEINFSVRLSQAQFKKIDVHLAKIGQSKTAFIESVIDNISEVQNTLNRKKTK